jgi:hypothetical protein
VELEMLCAHGPGGMCTNCMPETGLGDRKHMSYSEWMHARHAKCEHAFRRVRRAAAAAAQRGSTRALACVCVCVCVPCVRAWLPLHSRPRHRAYAVLCALTACRPRTSPTR